MKNGLTKTYCVKFIKDRWTICKDMTGLFGLSYMEAQQIVKQKKLIEC